MALSGTSSITSPSIACIARCGRAAISSAAVGSGVSVEGEAAMIRQSTRGRRPQEPLAQQRRLRTLIAAVAEFQPNAARQSGSRDCHPGRWRMGTVAAWTGPRGARGRLYPARHRRHLGRRDPCQPSLVRADAPRDRGGVRRYGAGGPQCAGGTAGRFRPAASGRVHLPGVQAARQRSDRRAGPAGIGTGKQGHRPRCAGRAPLA